VEWAFRALAVFNRFRAFPAHTIEKLDLLVAGFADPVALTPMACLCGTPAMAYSAGDAGVTRDAGVASRLLLTGSEDRRDRCDGGYKSQKFKVHRSLHGR
jgi:hypothetical protein